jgi:hypothetical protein
LLPLAPTTTAPESIPTCGASLERGLLAFSAHLRRGSQTAEKKRQQKWRSSSARQSLTDRVAS